MNVVEKEAIKYAEYEFFNSDMYSTVENLSSELGSKLYSFKRSKDRLLFLNVLRQEVVKQKIDHEKDCKTVDCSISAEKEAGLFVIDQEIEVISQDYEYHPKKEDEFSSEEKSELHNLINQIKDDLRKLGYGQEIIFNEMEDLKDHLNLGKKNWFQLLKGKLFDLSVGKALDEVIVKEVYGRLSSGFENLPDLIDKM